MLAIRRLTWIVIFGAFLLATPLTAVGEKNAPDKKSTPNNVATATPSPTPTPEAQQLTTEQRKLFDELDGLLSLLEKIPLAENDSNRQLKSAMSRLRGEIKKPVPDAGELQKILADLQKISVKMGAEAPTVPKELNLEKLVSALAQTQAPPKTDTMQQILRDIEQIHKLKFTAPIPSKTITQEEAAKIMKGLVDKDFSDEEATRISKTLVKFGLLPPGMNFKKTMLDMVAEQVAGFYDTEKKTYYSISSAPLQKYVAVHELTHGLQDQHYDLKKLDEQDKENDDRSSAKQAVFEGDATLLMELYARQNMGIFEAIGELADMVKKDRPDSLDKSPVYLSEGLLFPYISGKQFCLEVAPNADYDLLNKVFANLPQSTEIIMHPEKYSKKPDPPLDVKLPDFAKTLGKAYTSLMVNTHGELGVHLLLHSMRNGPYTQLPDFPKRILGNPIQSGKAAAGWGGDRFQAFEHKPTGNILIIWKTVWDTPQDAREFFDEYTASAKSHYKLDVPLPPVNENIWTQDTPAAKLHIEIKDKAVFVVDGCDLALAKKITDLLKKEKKK